MLLLTGLGSEKKYFQNKQYWSVCCYNVYEAL